MLDSIHQRSSSSYHAERKKSRFKLWLGLILIIILVFAIFVGSRLFGTMKKFFERSGTEFSFRQLFIASDTKLIGEEQGQVRILLMGIGGEQHEGGTLTDTMILATLDLVEKDEPRLGLVSIPRDLVVFLPGYDYRKINTAYAFGGSDLAINAVERLTGKDIPYYGVIDFEGFKKIIDDLDGIEITVEQTFTDAMFPDRKNGYLPPLTFEAGKQKMDGERALQFVRSRHGSNNEGNDFARSKRQQKVLKAVKDEITSFRVLTNLNLIEKILEDLSDHISTNLKPHEVKRIYELGRAVKNENIYSLTVDGSSGLVCDQIEETTSAYVLVPCQGLNNYEGIQNYIKNQFLFASFQQENPSLEIQNATKIEGLSSKTQNFLSLPNLKIFTGNFKGEIFYPETIIYDNTKGRKPETLQYLRNKLGAKLSASPFPFPTSSPNPDFVIVAAPDLEEKLK